MFVRNQACLRQKPRLTCVCRSRIPAQSLSRTPSTSRSSTWGLAIERFLAKFRRSFASLRKVRDEHRATKDRKRAGGPAQASLGGQKPETTQTNRGKGGGAATGTQGGGAPPRVKENKWNRARPTSSLLLQEGSTLVPGLRTLRTPSHAGGF